MLRIRDMRVCLVLISIVLLFDGSDGQLSKPAAHDDNFKEVTESNKFLQRDATDDSLPLPRLDEESLANTQCPQHIELRWQAEVSSSIYATPLISDINSDGKLEVVVPSFVHYLEVLEGADGEKLQGWPSFHQSTVHASALAYDIDKDGSKEIVLATFNGEVLFFRSMGYILGEKLVVPRLPVRKNWYVGLDPDHVDRSHPDVKDDSFADELLHHGDHHQAQNQVLSKDAGGNHQAQSEVLSKDEGLLTNITGNSYGGNHQAQSEVLSRDAGLLTNITGNSYGGNHQTQNEVLSQDGGLLTNITGNSYGGNHQTQNEVLSQDQGLLTNITGNSDGTNSTVTNITEVATTDNLSSRLSENDTVVTSQADNSSTSDNVVQKKVDETLGQDSIFPTVDVLAAEVQAGKDHLASNRRRRLLQLGDAESKVDPAGNKGGQEQEITVENDQEELDEDAAASFDVFRDEDENMEDGLTEEYGSDYDDYVNEAMWGDDEFTEAEHVKQEDFIQVDSHILCTPVIADIDGDGVDEMVVAASYFYDREYYEMPAHEKELGDLDLGKYVAGGIVVFDLATKQVKWSVHLDLSTDSVSYRAYIYSAPTVADLDGDGYLEIIVGTSFGFVYVFHHNGTVKEHFPLQMGEIQAQVLVADINDDGLLEIVTADTKGNVAAWTGEGKEIWERHLKSLISQGPTLGDVDGDGHSDVVVPTTSGNLYVLKGSDGSNVGPYPFRTHGRVMAPALLVDLTKRGAERKGLTIAVTSFDGYFYLIDGPTGCADATDIGETSYSTILAENVDGGDDLDLIVSTMNGNVYCFQTPAPYHPLKAWPSQSQGRNVLASRHQREGVYVLPSSRAYRDEAGGSFFVELEIVDKHRVPNGHHGPYNVTVSLMVPSNYRSSKIIKHNYTLANPGVFQMKLDSLPLRAAGTVLVEMVDKNGLYFTDEFSLTFHMHYYRLLKWLLALPLLGTTALIFALTPQEGAHLPSFSSSRHQM